MAYTTINKSTDYFNTVTYSGNSSTNNITGVGFQPDWLWIKARNYAENHALYDVIRGVTKQLYSNTSGAETTNATALTAFASDGFNLATANGNTNANGTNYVSWNWKAGGSGSSNSDGSITSTVSANTTAGFSIVKYTGYGGVSTVGHGLGVAPNLIINKNFESGSTSWFVGLIDWTKRLKLEGTNDWAANTVWNNTAPTNQVFSLNGTNANSSGQDYIAYCFAEKTGYSKFGSFVGNGNNDGPFVYTGFKPSFILLKNTTDGRSWLINDNKRDGYNPNSKTFTPNTNEAENTGTDRTDFLSNGFKLRVGSSTAWNGSGNEIIYIAFGQSLVGSNNVPCTAR